MSWSMRSRKRSPVSNERVEEQDQDIRPQSKSRGRLADAGQQGDQRDRGQRRPKKVHQRLLDKDKRLYRLGMQGRDLEVDQAEPPGPDDNRAPAADGKDHHEMHHLVSAERRCKDEEREDKDPEPHLIQHLLHENVSPCIPPGGIILTRCPGTPPISLRFKRDCGESKGRSGESRRWSRTIDTASTS